MNAHTPESAPDLLAELTQARAQVATLRTALGKFGAWFEAQAARDEKAAENNRFETMREAYLADARNYRAMASDVTRALSAVPSKSQPSTTGEG